MEQPCSLQAVPVYALTVTGAITQSWLTGFSDGAVQTEPLAGGGPHATRATIVTEQAGLVGLLRRLHALGVVLISIRQATAAAARLTTHTRCML
jgi:hypothetical protein